MTSRSSLFAAMAICSAFAMFSSCQGTAIDNTEKAVTDSLAAEPADSLIDEFPLHESVMTASESYKVTSADDSTLVWYVTLSTSVQWPETIGKYKITNLQDSIIDLTFGAEAPKKIKKAIRQSITDLAQYGLEGKVETVDTIPQNAGVEEFYSTKTLQLIECTSQTVTYSATFSDFLGGAHPNSGATPFSFVLATDQPVTMEYLFLDGAQKELTPLILEAIAASHSIGIDELKSALLNSPDMVRKNVYLLNGNIAFHYNPYEILPYSYGPSEAYISPIQVEKYLTPAAKKLLLE
ncbi:MAG: RsiV family protein [Firmicutes bacterium]|nr:RsiV family protein [Bacillota bacterium]MCM1400416.1 RsiV family protein [Bacteroides sp.]MCM1477636.1 RsiV family protein [Bacteroides sp.]